MKRVTSFIRRAYEKLTNAWRWFMGTPGPTAAAPALSVWTIEDRDQFKSFLLSTSGKRFVARLRAFESLNAISAVKNPLNIEHNGGKACGYSECIEHLISLSTAGDQKDTARHTTPVTANETPEEREARDNRELLERFTS